MNYSLINICNLLCGDHENGLLDLLKDYSHNLIHDHFIPYYTYLPHAIHCECNDHIRRYLKAGIDFSGSITFGKMITLPSESQ